MRFVRSKEDAVEKINTCYPEFEKSRIIGDNSGWCNYVVTIDDKYIFRFPKNEQALKAVEYEKRILNILNEILPSNIRVPNYIYEELEGDFPLVGYEMLKGKYLSNKSFQMMDVDERNFIFNLICLFINTLHSIDSMSNEFIKKDSRTEFMPLYEEIKKICYPYFTDEDIKATDKLFNSYFSDEKMTGFLPTIIHGDLSLDHILVTDEGIGIFDFGDVKVFDPAYDYIWAYYLDKDLYNKLLCNMDDYKYRIEEFYIKRTPYYGLIYSIKMNNDEQFQRNMHYLHEVLYEVK